MSSCPFVIDGTSGSVTVLGTSFNFSTSDEGSTVHLLTGKLQLSDRESKVSVTLNPGNWALIDSSGNIDRGVITDNNFLAWKDKRLVFENMAMADIIPQLESHFDIKINVENDAILQCRLRTVFEDPTLKEVFEELKFLLDITFSINDNVVELKGGACAEK